MSSTLDDACTLKGCLLRNSDETSRTDVICDKGMFTSGYERISRQFDRLDAPFEDPLIPSKYIVLVISIRWRKRLYLVRRNCVPVLCQCQHHGPSSVILALRVLRWRVGSLFGLHDEQEFASMAGVVTNKDSLIRLL